MQQAPGSTLHVMPLIVTPGFACISYTRVRRGAQWTRGQAGIQSGYSSDWPVHVVAVLNDSVHVSSLRLCTCQSSLLASATVTQSRYDSIK